jgi:transcriptional regulator with XRE-family HTH domain
MPKKYKPKKPAAERYIKYDIELTVKNMKPLREAAGLDQGELAELINCSRPTINKIENGTANPGYKVLVRLYRILHGLVIE